MNAETAALISRAYNDIVDDILTAMVGGVVNEPIIFDLKLSTYPLAQPAAGLRGVSGTRAGAPHSFVIGIDFVFDEGNNAVAWLEDGDPPDDESAFYVDYFRPPAIARSPITDINVGSVTRTLSEAIGREIATVYEEINRAYRSAFVDTAEGDALDFVVSILGVTRKTADFAIGLVSFYRDTSRPGGGSISIPPGTSLRTAKGVVFETTEPRTLQRGQLRIDVPVRAAEGFGGDAGRLGAGEITELVLRMEGIARVTNPEATRLGTEDESDAELRLRAKAAVRALGKATVAALLKAAFDAGAEVLELWDPAGPPDKRSDIGTVALLVETEPESFDGVRAAVEETRAAGILASLVARYVYFTPHVVVNVATELSAAGQSKLTDEVIAGLRAYAESLGSGEPALGAELVSAVTGVTDVVGARIVEVTTQRSDITSSPPGARITDRDLVRGPAAARATDAEIEAGTFEIAATVDGESWWVVLDMQPSDVLIEVGGGG